jgi:hypothetical protein
MEVKKIIDLLYSSVVAEGGDGDALWYTKYTPLINIPIALHNYNEEHNTGWIVLIKEDHILWGINQEWVMITDSKEFYNEQPDWIILKIKC